MFHRAELSWQTVSVSAGNKSIYLSMSVCLESYEQHLVQTQCCKLVRETDTVCRQLQPSEAQYETLSSSGVIMVPSFYGCNQLQDVLRNSVWFFFQDSFRALKHKNMVFKQKNGDPIGIELVTLRLYIIINYLKFPIQQVKFIQEFFLFWALV